jgi:serine/threonine protein kinase
MKLCESCGAVVEDGDDVCAFDGSAALTPLFPGPRVIGARYLLEQRVAGGTMGIVVRATHLQVGSTVAVKLMRPTVEGAHVALARFQREAQILGQIKHPNAVLVIDFGVEQRGAEDQPYIVMEFLRGESLLSVLERKGRLSLEELERILVPLCDAVEEAHAVGVIHRDLKPSNVVLEKLRDGSDIVKVLDFGIAKFVARGARPKQRAEPPPGLDASLVGAAGADGEAIDALAEEEQVSAEELAELLADDDDFLEEVVHTRDERPTAVERVRFRSVPEGQAVRDPTTEVGFMIGTIPYMAPEQMTGERLSRRTDVHAVGVLAFQCLAGRLPYDGDDEDIIAAKLSDERPSLLEMGVELPREIDELLQRTFALDPAERPATVRELGEAVRAAVHQARAQGDADPVLQAVVQLGAVGRALSLVGTAVQAWLDGARGEEHYVRARDVLLAVDAPLRRARAALEATSAPLEPEPRAALAEARAALELRVTPVRTCLARLEPLSGAGAELGEYLTALWMRLDVVTQEILDLLALLTEDEKSSESTSPLLPMQLFAQSSAPRAASLSELADRLLVRDPLDAVDALDELIHGALDQVVRALGPGQDEKLASHLARALWRHADTLLLHELSPSRRAFRLLPFLAGLRDLPAAAPFAILARALGSATLDEAGAHAALAELPRVEERAVLARCLLVHPSPQARAVALGALDLSELWTVIAHPVAPLAVEAVLFHHVRERAPTEYLKIFFFCVRENLRAAASAADVLEALKLVQAFFHVPSFHEDLVFEPLLELERSLRVRASSLGATLPDELSYGEALAAFTAAGVKETQPLEQMRDIPLPIQRKLAREGHFLSYFVSHSNDRVARETLPHLYRLEDVTNYLRIPTIHRVVLTELAKRKRFFRKDAPRLALLQNPKTPAMVARVFLPFVSLDQLRILSTNKHINADVRRLILATLARPRD